MEPWALHFEARRAQGVPQNSIWRGIPFRSRRGQLALLHFLRFLEKMEPKWSQNGDLQNFENRQSGVFKMAQNGLQSGKHEKQGSKKELFSEPVLEWFLYGF